MSGDIENTRSELETRYKLIWNHYFNEYYFGNTKIYFVKDNER